MRAERIYDEFLQAAIADEIRIAIKAGDMTRAEALTCSAEAIAANAEQRHQAVLEAVAAATA